MCGIRRNICSCSWKILPKVRLHWKSRCLFIVPRLFASCAVPRRTDDRIWICESKIGEIMCTKTNFNGLFCSNPEIGNRMFLAPTQYFPYKKRIGRTYFIGGVVTFSFNPVVPQATTLVVNDCVRRRHLLLLLMYLRKRKRPDLCGGPCTKSGVKISQKPLLLWFSPLK